MEDNTNTGIVAEENDEINAQNGELQEEAGIPEDAVPAKPRNERRAEDIYVYDAADDEPVEDKDLYRDYTGNASVQRHSVPETNVVSAAPGSKVIRPEPEVPVTREPEPRAQATVQPSAKVNRIYTLNTVISMITLCVVAAGIFTGYAYINQLERDIRQSRARISELETKKDNEEPDADEEYIDALSLIDEEELNEPELPEGESSVDIERGKLLLYDSYVGYSWVPIISGVKPNTYIKENFHVDDEYRMTYVQDGEESSYFGIDVSSYQGDIDWDAVRSDGVEFAILRIGVRGYGEEGIIKLDDKFFYNYDKAHKAGIDLGVYFYSQAISVDEAVEEAEFVLEQLDGRKLEYPVVFDWEPVDAPADGTTPRTEDVMPGTLTLSALAFCETVLDAGYEAMLYTNKKMAYIKYDMRRFTDYPVWLALYNTDLTYYYDFDMWQYGFGKVDGIEGDVDLDIAMIR